MELAAVLTLITRGLAIAAALLDAGQNAAPTITRLYALGKKAFSGQIVTQADLDEEEIFLDAQIAEFNLDLPPDA